MTTTAHEMSSRRCMGSDPGALFDRLVMLVGGTEEEHD